MSWERDRRTIFNLKIQDYKRHHDYLVTEGDVLLFLLLLQTKLYVFSMALVEPELPALVCLSRADSCSIDSIRRRTEPPLIITCWQKNWPIKQCFFVLISTNQLLDWEEVLLIFSPLANLSRANAMTLAKPEWIQMVKLSKLTWNWTNYLNSWLCDDVLCQGNIGRSAWLERNRMHSEMFQHVKHRLKPEMLHSTLPFRTDC